MLQTAQSFAVLSKFEDSYVATGVSSYAKNLSSLEVITSALVFRARNCSANIHEEQPVLTIFILFVENRSDRASQCSGSLVQLKVNNKPKGPSQCPTDHSLDCQSIRFHLRLRIW